MGNIHTGKENSHDVSEVIDGSIEFYYHEGQQYYQRSQILSPDKEDGEEEALQRLAIEYLKKSLMHTGSTEQKLIKIKSLLLLIEIPDKNVAKTEKEIYFYDAVEIGERYLGKSFFSTSLGKEILAVYMSDIDQTLQMTFPKEYMPQLETLICTTIISKSNARLQERLQEASKTKTYLQGMHSAHQIFGRLEDALGPVRLRIISKDSDEILVNHGFPTYEGEDASGTFSHSKCISVVVFDRTRKYLIHIDRGSNEVANQYNEHEFRSIIYPILDAYIRELEFVFFDWNMDNSSFIEDTDTISETCRERVDYRSFISQVIREYVDISQIHGSREKYINQLLMALDICRYVTQKNDENEYIEREYLLQKIDHILGENIDTSVLHMVKFMLLSRNETMNGSGYPFGSSKDKIPLEGKIYAIIRSYEALGRAYKNTKKILMRMDEWLQGGYFDRTLYQIFLHNIENKKNDMEMTGQEMQSSSIYSSQAYTYRVNLYAPHVDIWYEIIQTTKEIEEQYSIGRGVKRAEGMEEDEYYHIQRQAFQEISRLKGILLRVVKPRIIIIVGRHGMTKSDKQGISGSKDESLAPEGELASQEIGEKLGGLVLDIYSNDISRSNETAEIVRQKVIEEMVRIFTNDVNNQEIPSSRLCPVHIEHSLRNPDKHLESYWGQMGPRSRLSTIILDQGTKPMVEFLEDVNSPLMEPTVLLITHGHNANILTALLENYSHREKIMSQKSSMANGMICSYFLQGGSSAQELFFPIMEWKHILKEVNDLTMGTFGKIFYNPKNVQTDAIRLHDEFIDFIHNNVTRYPEKISQYLAELQANPVTSHFHGILKNHMK